MTEMYYNTVDSINHSNIVLFTLLCLVFFHLLRAPANDYVGGGYVELTNSFLVLLVLIVASDTPVDLECLIFLTFLLLHLLFFVFLLI